MENIKNIGVNDGHTVKGPGSGAVGKIAESEHTRLVGDEVRRLIAEKRHNAINCTVDSASSSSKALELIVQQANRQDLDWFIAIHFNAGGGNGVEVYTYKGRQYQDAVDVCKNISALGFRNRGVKEGTGLYVIKKTKAKAMLIEVCFVDTDDANKYLEVGYKAIAKAIVDALIDAIEQEPSTPPSSTTTKSIDVIAREVIAGQWGNGAERTSRLSNAGYNPTEVQKRVNEILGGSSSSNLKSVNEVAKEVIQGKWGNGQERVNKLKAAGYNPVEVQKEVNRLL